MKYKIMTYDKEKNKFSAIDEEGNHLFVDPYVGCAYEGKPADLIGKWFITEHIQYYRPLLLPGEHDFKEVEINKNCNNCEYLQNNGKNDDKNIVYCGGNEYDETFFKKPSEHICKKFERHYRK